MCLLATAVLVASLTFVNVECERYIVPEASLEFLSPRGLKISIPDIDPEVKLVAFHVNVNEEFDSLEHGQWAKDIIKKRDGRWTYVIPELRAKQGDTIYYWIYVIVDGLGYHGLDRSYKVTQPNPHEKASTGQTTQSTPDRVTEQSCQISATTWDGGRKACVNQRLLETTFRTLSDRWRYDVQIGGSLPEEEFTVFNRDSGVTYLRDGDLVIKPTLLEDKYNETFVRIGHLALAGCTSNVQEECKRQGVSYLILPPILSARLTTRSSFSFRYGIVDIKAKFPRGDWIVPELWLQPKSGGSDRIVIAVSQGNADYNSLLEAGIVVSDSSQLVDTTGNSLWSQNYHEIRLVWTKEEMVFSIDGQEIGRISTGEGSAFNQEFYISLGVHVAGSRDFPDNLKNKPWKNSDPKRFVSFWQAKQSWKASWDDNSALRIQSVKVTAL